jgi:hypothetical protein
VIISELSGPGLGAAIVTAKFKLTLSSDSETAPAQGPNSGNRRMRSRSAEAPSRVPSPFTELFKFLKFEHWQLSPSGPRARAGGGRGHGHGGNRVTSQ